MRRGARARGRWVAAVAIALAALVAFANIGTSPADAAGPRSPLVQATPSSTPIPPPPACDITSWEKTPPAERDLTEERFVSCPTEDGLGECKQGIAAFVLNTNNAGEELTTLQRNSDGGFTAALITNCRVSAIKWEVKSNSGEFLVGAVADATDYDEVEYVYQKAKVYLHHPLDAPGIDYDGDGSCDDACPGTPMLNEYGQLVEDPAAADSQEKVKGYLYRFGYKNGTRTDPNTGTTTDILNRNLVYDFSYVIEPYPNAPDNYSIKDAAALLEFFNDGPIETIKRYINPEYWIQVGIEKVMEGAGNLVMLGMCTVMSRFMSDDAIKDFDTYPETDSIGNFTYWTSAPTATDALNYDTAGVKIGDTKLRWVEGHDNDNVNNKDRNCKRPEHKYEDQLKKIGDEAFALRNEISVARGLPPMGNPHGGQRAIYAQRVIDGVDPRGRDDADWVDFVAYDSRNITLFPRIAMDPNARANFAENVLTASNTGIMTYTGLLVGTPAELTYERGLVRIGWSLILNVMVAVMVLFISWIGLNQVVKGFTGSRNQADWRELVPRFILAIIAAVTSYWWCSLLVDTADGISRYLAAGMRVTPADITGTLGQAVTALILKQASGFGASFLVGAQFGLFIRSMGMTLLVAMMVIYSIIILLIIGQFIMRIVLINLLIMLSPLAMILWALPETAGWGKKWMSTFTMTLWQHGLQLVCFAMGLWFVKLGSPLNAVSGTGLGMEGLVSKVVGLALPMEMIWAFALGIMSMMMCYKLPGLMGNSIMESWTSTLSFAAMGARAIGTIAATSFAGPAGTLLSGMGMKTLGGALQNMGGPGGGQGLARLLNPTGRGPGGGGDSGAPDGGSAGMAMASNAVTETANSGGPGFGDVMKGWAAGAGGALRAAMITGNAVSSPGGGGPPATEGFSPSFGSGGPQSDVSRPEGGVETVAAGQPDGQAFENLKGTQSASPKTVGMIEDNWRLARKAAGDGKEPSIMKPVTQDEGFSRPDFEGDNPMQQYEVDYVRENLGEEGIADLRQASYGEYVQGEHGALTWNPVYGSPVPANEAQREFVAGVGTERASNLTNGSMVGWRTAGGAAFMAGSSAIRASGPGYSTVSRPGEKPVPGQGAGIKHGTKGEPQAIRSSNPSFRANLANRLRAAKNAGSEAYVRSLYGIPSEQTLVGKNGKPLDPEKQAMARDLHEASNQTYIDGTGDQTGNDALRSIYSYEGKQDGIKRDATEEDPRAFIPISGEQKAAMRQMQDSVGPAALDDLTSKQAQVIGRTEDGAPVMTVQGQNEPVVGGENVRRLLDGYTDRPPGSIGTKEFDRISGYGGKIDGKNSGYLTQRGIIGAVGEDGEGHKFTQSDVKDHYDAHAVLGQQQFDSNMANRVTVGGRDAVTGDLVMYDSSAEGGRRVATDEEQTLVNTLGANAFEKKHGRPPGVDDQKEWDELGSARFNEMFGERRELLHGHALNVSDVDGAYEDRAVGYRDDGGNFHAFSADEQNYYDAKRIIGDEQHAHNLANNVSFLGRSEGGADIRDASVDGGVRKATADEEKFLVEHGRDAFDKAYSADTPDMSKDNVVMGRVGLQAGVVQEGLSMKEELALHQMEKKVGFAGVQAHIANGVRDSGVVDANGKKLMYDNSTATGFRVASKDEVDLTKPEERVAGLSDEQFNENIKLANGGTFMRDAHTVERSDGKLDIAPAGIAAVAETHKVGDDKGKLDTFNAILGEKIVAASDPTVPNVSRGQGRGNLGGRPPTKPSGIENFGATLGGHNTRGGGVAGLIFDKVVNRGGGAKNAPGGDELSKDQKPAGGNGAAGGGKKRSVGE